MPGGGRLVIETGTVEVTVSNPVSKLGAGTYVTIAVTDTGHGIDPVTLERIFEPFFTTKELGKGTGLGLSTVHGIVAQSGGAITVESTQGKGTVFQIYFPLCEVAADEEPTAQPLLQPRRSTATVLLVEDEAPLRTLVSRTLATAGYRVYEAANAVEALSLNEKARVDLVLTDVVMPGMSGAEMVERMNRNRDDLLVLYMSGYDRELLGNRQFRARTCFIPKPFTPEELLAKVGELFGSATGRVSVA
jgi:CheY-like chemotaxis protein